SAGGDAAIFVENVILGRGPGRIVALLEEQPLPLLTGLGGATGTDEHPAAAKLSAVEFEFEFAGAVVLVRIAERLPFAAIPKHDCAAAVFAFGNDSFERTIIDRMILDVHRQPFDGRIETRPLRH